MLGSYQPFDLGHLIWYNYINDGGSDGSILALIYYCFCNCFCSPKIDKEMANMKPLTIPPEFEAEILRKTALRLLRIAIALEQKGEVLQAMVLRSRAKEFEEQAKHRIN